MLITDHKAIGVRLRTIRKSRGKAQTEIAAAAGISGRAYADIERGAVNMRVDTMIRICEALYISPNEIFTVKNCSITSKQQELLQQLDNYSDEDKTKLSELLSTVQKIIDHNHRMSCR